MGKRLTAIATRTGDDGTTGLGDGSRTSKDTLRVHAMGDVDELNSTLGLLLCETLPEDVRGELVKIQHDLFDLGGALCIPGWDNIKQEQVLRLDQLLADYNATLPRLEEFILPGGCKASAITHVARTICRRAERVVVSLAKTEDVPQAISHYLNRLSDLLFVLARVLNRAQGGNDVLWQPDLNKSK